MKTLVIVESPKKAKSISIILGKNYIVEPSYGHIKDLESSKKYPLGINFGTWEPRYNIIPEKMGVVKALLGAATQADKIYLASDDDREGSCIATHLFQILESSGKEIKRLKFHEITEKGIKKALKNPTDLDVNLFEAQQARRVLDRIIGYSISPFLQYKAQNLSAGRVQSIALKMIVEREKQIESFKPVKYWVVTAQVQKNDKKFECSFTSNEEIKDLKLDVLKVSKISYEIKIKPAKSPFITSTFLTEAHSKLKLSAAEAMKIAQGLYEDGFISYMRTDSVRCSPDSIESARSLLKEKNLPIPTTPNVFKNTNLAQDAHEAIRPTSFETTPDDLLLSDNNKKVLQLIYDRFLASQCMPLKSKVVTIELKNGQLLFKSSGRTILEKGWTEIYSEDTKETILPDLVEGEELPVLRISIKEKETQPPPRYNERTLIQELEKNSIGRPSTYATIVPKILQRGYIEEKKEQFMVTETGKEIIAKLDPYFSFMKYDYTANLELELDKIAEGKSNYFDTIVNFYKSFNIELAEAYAQTSHKSEIKCAKCNSSTEKFLYFGVNYIHCVNYPSCDFKIRFREGEGESASLPSGESFTPCKKCGFFTRLVPLGTSDPKGHWAACVRGIRCR